MVIHYRKQRRRRGALNIEMIVALGIFVTAMIPIAYGFLNEIKLARAYYHDAVAMELLDGETEVLAAGNWKAYPEGEHALKVVSPAASNLPPGKFILIRKPNALTVEWRPEKHGRRIVREVKLP